jgi:Transglycosylase-like domain/Putative peptidoglycan binding domain
MPEHEPSTDVARRRLVKILTPLVITGGVLVISPTVAGADCTVTDGVLERTDSSQTSESVECLQQSLHDHGVDSGPVDGWFGPITERAVVRFQRAHGLTVDGWMGAETRGALSITYDGSADIADESSSEDVAAEEVGTDGTDEPDVVAADDGDDGGGTVWDSLAQCESGGDWHISTGNGYYGGLQFLLSTWQAYGGSGYPHENSREEQIRVAENLRADAGWSPWPACSDALGL